MNRSVIVDQMLQNSKKQFYAFKKRTVFIQQIIYIFNERIILIQQIIYIFNEIIILIQGIIYILKKKELFPFNELYIYI